MVICKLHFALFKKNIDFIKEEGKFMFKTKYISLLCILLNCFFLLANENTTKTNHIEDSNMLIKSKWNEKAFEWDNFVGEHGEGDINRFYQSDPVLWNLLGNVKNLTILDAGCGTGYISMQLAKKGANVIGVDIAEKMIEIAKKKIKNSEIRIDFRAEELDNLQSIQDNTIDKIVSNYVLMDLENLQKCMRSFYRILKPKGEIVIIIVHPCFPFYRCKIDPTNSNAVNFYWDIPYFDEHMIEVHPTPKSDSVAFMSSDASSDQVFSSSFILFHRPLSAYWKTFTDSNFIVVDFQEPTIHKEDVNKSNTSLSDDVITNLHMIPLSVAFLLKKQ